MVQDEMGLSVLKEGHRLSFYECTLLSMSVRCVLTLQLASVIRACGALGTFRVSVQSHSKPDTDHPLPYA